MMYKKAFKFVNVYVLLFLIFTLTLLVSCSTGISQTDAEKTAKNFLQEKTRFFTKDNTSAKMVSEYNIASVNSQKTGTNWIVIITVTSNAENKTKKADVSVIVDSSGKVIEFNGITVK